MVLDLVMLGFVVFLMWRGSCGGFFWSLAGPLAFFAATALALLYYNATKNIIMSLTIGLLGPFLLQWFLLFILRSFGLIQSDKKPSALSSMSGAAVTVCWGLLFVLPVIILLALIPPLNPRMAALREYLQDSWTLKLSQPLMQPLLQMSGIKIPAPSTVPASSPASSSTTAMPPALQAISQDPRMQALLKDPKVAAAIANHNYAVLISNPKFQELIQDPAFIQKALTAYGQIQPPTDSHSRERGNLK